MATSIQRPVPRLSSRLFENYEIHRLLGTGTYGAVFDCMNKFEKKNYAVKVMKFDAVDTEREISNLVQLPNHPNLVQYYTCWKDAFGQEDVATIRQRFGDEDFGHKNFEIPTGLRSFDAICILMELCGEDLRQWLAYRESVDERTSINIFQQIAQGVEHLHKHGLFHRDLKPENLFFAKLAANNNANSTVVKIGDLGIATKSKQTKHTSGIGTRAYLAPEQEGNSYGPPVDVFALGIILLELLYPPMQPNADEEEEEEGKAGNHTKIVIGLKYLHTVPEEVFRLWPTAADLILKMVSIEVEDRPKFPEILSTIAKISQKWDITQDENSEVQEQLVKEEEDIQGQLLVNIPAIRINSSSSGYDSIGNDNDDCPEPSHQNPEVAESDEPSSSKDPTWHIAETSEQLQSLLLNVSANDTFELLASHEYSGNFVIHTENITLIGNGATITGASSNTALKISADNCTIKDLHLVGGITGLFICGNGNRVESLVVGTLSQNEVTDASCGLLLQGSNNSLTNCTIQGQEKGILVTGDGNSFEGISISACAQKAVVLQGSGNSLQNLGCLDCPKNGVWIGGDENRILGMVYKLSREFSLSKYKFGQVSSSCAITIGRGKDNFVSNFKNFAQSGEFKYGVQSSIYVSRLKIVDSRIGRLYLEGNEHTVENSTALIGAAVIGNGNYFKGVDFGSKLELQGKLHKLYKCSADLFVKHGSGCDVEIIQCNFDG